MVALPRQTEDSPHQGAKPNHRPDDESGKGGDLGIFKDCFDSLHDCPSMVKLQTDFGFLSLHLFDRAQSREFPSRALYLLIPHITRVYPHA